MWNPFAGDPVEKKVFALLREAASPEGQSVTIAPDVELKQLGLDSMALVMLVVRFEEELNVDVADAEPGTIRTVGDVLRFARALVEKRKVA